MSRPPPSDFEAIKRELGTRVFGSLEEVQAFLQQRVAQYNAAPQAELGGLSPAQMHELLTGDWQTTGLLRLQPPPPDDARRSPFVANAAILLSAASAKAGLKATAAGNLSRAVVREMVEQMRWPEYDREDFWHLNKVLNEEDVWPLHIVRLTLGTARLLRRRKGAFHATPRGRALAVAGEGGALLVHLFRTFFREINLAYLSRLGPEEQDPLQWRAALLFLRLVTADEGWRSPEEWEHVLAHDRPPPPVIGGRPWSSFQARWLRPLESFGLLEGREVPGEFPQYPEREYRRTTLATTVLRFPNALVTSVQVRRSG